MERGFIDDYEDDYVGFEAISPVKIYNTLHVKNNTAKMCRNEGQRICTAKYRFSWMGKSPCNASFICDKLGGNICGDYGILLESDGKY